MGRQDSVAHKAGYRMKGRYEGSSRHGKLLDLVQRCKVLKWDNATRTLLPIPDPTTPATANFADRCKAKLMHKLDAPASFSETIHSRPSIMNLISKEVVQILAQEAPLPEIPHRIRFVHDLARGLEVHENEYRDTTRYPVISPKMFGYGAPAPDSESSSDEAVLAPRPRTPSGSHRPTSASGGAKIPPPPLP